MDELDYAYEKALRDTAASIRKTEREQEGTAATEIELPKWNHWLLWTDKGEDN